MENRFPTASWLRRSVTSTQPGLQRSDTYRKQHAAILNIRRVTDALREYQATGNAANLKQDPGDYSEAQYHSMFSPPPGIGLWEHRFNLAIGVVILVNLLVVAVEMDWRPPSDTSLGWIISDCLFTLIFIVEISVRMHWERWRWVYSVWNWFDFVIVVLAVTDIFIIYLFSGKGGIQTLTIFRVVRLLRLMRMVKLVRALQGIYAVMLGFWAVMKSMSCICAVMVFGVLLYSIIATTMIGRNPAFDDVRIYGDTVYDRFGTVYRSMYSLFELMTLEGWDHVARPLVEEQPATIIFVGSFIVIFTFGMLNMVVALVVEKTLEQSRQVNKFEEAKLCAQLAQDMIQLIAAFDHADTDDSGTLTLPELKIALDNNKAMRKRIIDMGVRIEEVSELFTMLDCDSTGEVSVREFVTGIAKLRAHTPSVWDAMATSGNVRGLLWIIVNLNERIEGIEKRLTIQDQVLQDILAAARRGSAPADQ